MKDTVEFVMIFSGIWFFIGAIFFTIGIVMCNIQKKKKINCTSKTYGKVIDIVKRRHHTHGSRRTHMYLWHPVFEYYVGEIKFIKESSIGRTEVKYGIGQEVEVYYNPKNYNEYYIGGENGYKILVRSFIAVGIVAMFFAIFFAIVLLQSGNA